MFIRQLHYLLALNKYRHFSRAAESCHVSQPALSNGIRELERELGITVVKRDRSFRGMTPEGERVIIWARRTLESLEALRQEAELVRDVPSGHLSIGVVPTAIHAASILSAEYRQITSRITLDVRSLSTPEILHLLDDQELHLAMLYASSVSDEVYDILPVFAERYVLIAAEQAVLPRELSWGEVADLPLCLLSRDMWNRQVLDGIFRSHDVAPNVVLETNALRVLLAEVRSARSFSIIPLSALSARTGAAGLVAHPIIPDHVEDICLVRLKRGAQTALSHVAWKIAGKLDFQSILDDPWAKRPDYFRSV
ncbi:LysR substrate-binding domain-containing protein [Paracoccus saliphilus]|uniref:DNA-binding transcriptional regulator, LysR family n=1 Tax=Paracoccus saliphilus TaxID=405559 RepID=A0AA46A783_9RHOB|nr:LysR substrate-binding domain-containing protein [Paracoccus saliphilus]WCR02698.1 LysR family transcriptional regulator [Paracoccus saliphilus]SIT09573.1 DNA-binding transcriptional regulator, LysR family [Paracoccus saliphilus]